VIADFGESQHFDQLKIMAGPKIFFLQKFN
jgi:hypothetical protein